ncbi:MAG: alkyl sulfatase dimerization domain-containing protein [Bacteroidota bacterium]
MKQQSIFLLFVLLCLGACKTEAPQQPDPPSSQDQSVAMDELIQSLPYDDTTDFVSARKGFIATLKDPLIKNEDGSVAFDLNRYEFLKAEAPATVNPSLWRQSQLNSIHGLFEVMPGIYQIRGFDLANMTIIESSEGWIIIDPLTTAATAKAGLELVNQQLGEKPIRAVLFTHSHIDHFGGIRGIVSEADVEPGKLDIIAPAEFYEHSISENVIAGNAMIRRASYMFGITLEAGPDGFIGNGLGQNVARGTYGILRPTISIEKTGETLNIGGVELEFQFTPGAEAPAEFMFYLPQFKAFCQAEEINHTLHNLYTLRGAHVRNGLKWAKYIDESLLLYGGEVEVSFGSHHWPTWGNVEIQDFWKAQRDLYKFIHDETLHLANKGYNMTEIANMIQLPEALAKVFANRDYYGTISHNSKAQYQLYYGWFDANPANLNPLPQEQAAKKYVEYMGGSENILAKANTDFEAGEYRWVATALNHVVFAEPNNTAARELLAKTYRLLAQKAESGPWRNFYLTGAQELTQGINVKALSENATQVSADILTNMPLDIFYDYLAVRMDREKAKGKKYTFNLVFPDIDQQLSIHLENQVMHNRIGYQAPNPDATITLNKAVFNQIITGQAKGWAKVLSGDIKIDGARKKYQDFQSMVEEPFDLLFNIVEP